MGLLAQVDNKPTMRPPRIVIYAKGGVGKTTFAAGIPGVVVLPAEEGEGNLAYARLPRPESYEDVLNGIAELLREKHDFKAYCIDTIDHVEPLVWQAVCRDQSDGKKSYENIEDFGFAKGYVHADDYWRRLLKGLDMLRRERGMTTVVLAHTETRTVEDAQFGAYEQVQTKLHKRANALIHEWADVVGYAEIERSVVTNDDGKKDVRIARATGRRILHVEDRGGFIAKNRYGLPSPLPLEWAALRGEIAKAMKSDSNQAPAEGAKNEEAAA